MSTYKEFLEKKAKFPFPCPGVSGIGATDISLKEVQSLAPEWKATYVVRDEDLLKKLCQSLGNTLGDSLIPVGEEKDLLLNFAPGQSKNFNWNKNENEAKVRNLQRPFFRVHLIPTLGQSRTLIDHGFFPAAESFLSLYDSKSRFNITRDTKSPGGRSKVDFVVWNDGKPCMLVEIKSATVIKAMNEELPAHGIKLEWARDLDLMPRVFQKVSSTQVPERESINSFGDQLALYLGMWKLEWGFLTCHNFWIVCRLTKDGNTPFLAFAPTISIKDNSEPFRAFICAFLSATGHGPLVPASTLSSGRIAQILGTIPEKEEEYSQHDSDIDIDDNSSEYKPSPESSQNTDCSL